VGNNEGEHGVDSLEGLEELGFVLVVRYLHPGGARYSKLGGGILVVPSAINICLTGGKHPPATHPAGEQQDLVLSRRN
jgi:hypothetical protein